MASIADLTVDLKLLTASFEASAKRTQKEVSAMRASFDGLRGSLETIGRAFGALGIAVGVRQIVTLGLEALQSAGSLGELASQVGVSAQALQALQFAGAQAGVSQDEMNTAVARLSKTIGDAVSGQKQAVDAFNALGVGVLDAGGNVRQTEAVFVDIAGALLRIRDPARRAAAEVDLFGRAGQKLETVLADVSGGFGSLVRASQDAGAQLSDAAIATADKASDAFSRLGLQLQRAKENFATLVAGPLADLLEGIQKLNQNTDLNVVTYSRQANIEAAQRELEILTEQAAHLREQIEEASKTPIINPLLADWAKRDLADLQKRLEDINGLIQRQAGAINAYRQGPNPPHPFSGDLSGAPALGATVNANPAVKGAGDSAAKKIADVVAQLQLERDNLARTDAEQEAYNNLARAGVAANTAAGQQIRALTQDIYEQKAALEATNQLEEMRIQALQQQDDALAASFQVKQQMADQAAERATSLKQEIADNDELIAALERGAHAYQVEAEFIRLRNEAAAAGQPLIGAEIDQARQHAEVLVTQSERMQQLQQQSQLVQQAFMDIGEAAINGAVGIQTWGEVAKQILADVLKLMLQMIANSSVFNGGSSGGGAVGGILGSILGAIGLGGGGGGGGIGAPTRFGGLFAAGGNPPVGMPSIVGENGPELFVPHTAGTILPNGFQPGGVVVNQVNHYDLRGSDISRSELDQKIRKSQRETYGAVFKGINSGGSESKAVGRRRK